MFILVTGFLFTIISASVLSYVSIATMVGPWIAPTIVLLGNLLLLYAPKEAIPSNRKKIALMQAISSVGGITAVGLGFSLPILYFLDPTLFNSLLKNKILFCSGISLICLIAGSFGIVLGRMFAHRLLIYKQLPFPVSTLTHQIITSQSQQKEVRNLFGGVSISILLCVLRDGIFTFQGIIPKNINLLYNSITISLWPTLWAIGFTIGLKNIIPLLIGLFSKYAVLTPLNNHSLYLPIKLFNPLNGDDFITAFCAGLVSSEMILYLIKKPATLQAIAYKIYHYYTTNKQSIVILLTNPKSVTSQKISSLSFLEKLIKRLEPLIALACYFFYFSFFNFSFLSQLLLLGGITLALYEINYINGEVGLLQFGRYSVFLLVPMIVIFKIDYVQITALCVFFNISAATSSDLLCDYKISNYENINQTETHLAQWLGLILTAACIGIIFYLLFNTFTLGSADFFGQRGRSKALLIQSLNFNNYVVSLGFIYGIILKKLRISPTMTFGGILMPHNITTGFAIGGILSYLAGSKKISLLPFCSGVFSSESLWIIITLASKIIP